MKKNQNNDETADNILKDIRIRCIDSATLVFFGLAFVIIFFVTGENLWFFITGIVGITLGSIHFFGGNYLRYGKLIVNFQDISQALLDESAISKYNTIEITNEYTDQETKLLKLTNTYLQRLQKEIINLSRKGGVNLFIGIITTSIGAAILCYIIFNTYTETSNFKIYSFHLITHFSLIIFFEFFAFFFLRLYKVTQEDIKFYQNEISNIELKTFAAMTALASHDTSLLKPIIEQLAATERNFVLKKGETTIGLEREKLDKNEIIDLVRETIISTQRKNKK